MIFSEVFGHDSKQLTEYKAPKVKSIQKTIFAISRVEICRDIQHIANSSHIGVRHTLSEDTLHKLRLNNHGKIDREKIQILEEKQDPHFFLLSMPESTEELEKS